MIESDATTVLVPSETLGGSEGSESPEVSVRPYARPLRRHLGILPAVALSFLFSGASALSDAPLLFSDDSSVVFTQQKPLRRRVSLSEARTIALKSLRLSEERRSLFAEQEASDFASTYDWRRE